MVVLRTTTAVAAAVSLFAAFVTADVDPIIIKGNKFFYKSNGTQFFIKGVDYQMDVGSGTANGSVAPAGTQYSDPLADSAGCARDFPLMTQLQTNTIRVYAIDPTQNHDKCMQLAQQYGIYLVADLSAPVEGLSINRDDPQWNTQLYARYTSVIDAMSKYSNTIGFFAGNEVANAANNTYDIAFVKAAVRDMKAYVAKTVSRPIYVGYATSDDADIRVPIQDYLNCGSSSTSIDFYGYNIYSWCGKSDFVTSGYAQRTQELAGYPVPAFFAEYGCNQPAPRYFDDTIELYSTNMSDVWSGGIVYQWFQTENNYGLVSVSGSSVSTLADFGVLSTQIAKASPTNVNANSYNPTNTAARSCPTQNATFEAATPLPNIPNEQACECMVASLTCVAKSSVSLTAYADLFGIACGGGACTGIQNNATTGNFGAWEMCNATQQLSYAFNAYYNAQSSANKAQACNFGGNATTVSPNAASSCSAFLNQAGSGGTGAITSVPTGSGSGSGSGSGNGGSTTSSGVAFAVTVPAVDVGLVKLGAYLVSAMMVGAGIVLI